MRTNLRKQLLATTLLVGAFAPSAAYAQDTQSTVPDQNQPTNPVAAPPTGPVEAQPTPSVSSTGQAVQQPQEIIVTGSRIPQPNLESAAPVTVVNNQDIKLSGSSRIEDVLGQLPSAAATQNGGLANSATGTAEIDLRYLGAKRSVTLVNGRRLVPGDPNGTTQAADINIIPTSIVKRVEVLTGGASSVYGADAVAGVVNFIIDTDFSGIRFDGNYSIFQHNQHNPGLGPSGLHVDDILNAKNFAIPGDKWDGQSFDGTITIGSGFDDGRGHAMAYFGYRKVHPVLGAARDYSACTITNSNATGRPQCGGSATAFPGNIFFFPSSGLTTSTTGALGPGTIAVGGPANIFNYGPLNHFQRPDERYTAGAFANYEINDAIKPYLEFMFMDDRTLAQIAPSGDFFNTTSFNCPNATTGLGGNPLMSASQLAAICAPSNLV
jgi:outer membrane receptor protein involved in Fe transport